MKSDTVKELMWLSRYILYKYAHPTLHMITNIIHELHGLRVDDIEHYVSIPIDSEKERLLMEFIGELLRLGRPLKAPDISVEFILANEVDLLQLVEWWNVYNRLCELRSQVFHYLKIMDTMEHDRFGEVIELISYIRSLYYGYRCFITPDFLEEYLHVKEAGVEELRYMLRRCLLIIDLATSILDRILGAEGVRKRRSLT